MKITISPDLPSEDFEEETYEKLMEVGVFGRTVNGGRVSHTLGCDIDSMYWLLGVLHMAIRSIEGAISGP
jgi:hypothetical protein